MLLLCCGKKLATYLSCAKHLCAAHHSFVRRVPDCNCGSFAKLLLHVCPQDKLQEYERQVNELKAKLETVNREKTVVESQLQRSMSDERLRLPEKVRLLQRIICVCLCLLLLAALAAMLTCHSAFFLLLACI